MFSTPLKRSKTKEGNTIEVLKTNATLMGKMLISLRSRDGNLDDFFASEIQSYATSLSDLGKLHLPAKKSEIVDLLLHEIVNLPSTYHGKILDGAAIVHMLKTGTATTFAEYSESLFIPYVIKSIQSVKRLDIVWDQYKPVSLKADTREKRGKLKGIRRKVAASTKLPGNWQDFLRDETNKEELFLFLTNAVSCHTFPEGKTVVLTKGVETQSNQDFSIPDCHQEEADTRMHLKK